VKQDDRHDSDSTETINVWSVYQDGARNEQLSDMVQVKICDQELATNDVNRPMKAGWRHLLAGGALKSERAWTRRQKLL
jgi:hypothetical protein